MGKSRRARECSTGAALLGSGLSMYTLHGSGGRRTSVDSGPWSAPGGGRRASGGGGRCDPHGMAADRAGRVEGPGER